MSSPDACPARSPDENGRPPDGRAAALQVTRSDYDLRLPDCAWTGFWAGLDAPPAGFAAWAEGLAPCFAIDFTFLDFIFVSFLKADVIASVAAILSRAKDYANELF